MRPQNGRSMFRRFVPEADIHSECSEMRSGRRVAILCDLHEWRLRSEIGCKDGIRKPRL